MQGGDTPQDTLKDSTIGGNIMLDIMMACLFMWYKFGVELVRKTIRSALGYLTYYRISPNHVTDFLDI